MKDRKLLRPLYTVALILCLTVSGSPAAAQASSSTTATTTPIDIVIAPSCEGELIRMSGEMHVTAHNTQTGAGESNLVFVLQVMPQA